MAIDYNEARDIAAKFSNTKPNGMFATVAHADLQSAGNIIKELLSERQTLLEQINAKAAPNG